MRHTKSRYLRTSGAHYECQGRNPVIGHKVKISESQRGDYKRREAFRSILRDDHTSHVITGMINVKGMSGVYYGDYHGETVAIELSQDQSELIVTLFKDHKPKRRITRERKVFNHFGYSRVFRKGPSL